MTSLALFVLLVAVAVVHQGGENDGNDGGAVGQALGLWGMVRDRMVEPSLLPPVPRPTPSPRAEDRGTIVVTALAVEVEDANYSDAASWAAVRPRPATIPAVAEGSSSRCMVESAVSTVEHPIVSVSGIERRPNGSSDAGQKVVRISRFLEGYRSADGPSCWEGHFVQVVIPCESSWRLDPPGFWLGLVQFDPDTWAKARRHPDADYRDPFEQGWAVATWINAGVDPAGTGGWAGCW